MFLGGNWQLKDLQAGLVARRVREVGHRADSAGRRRRRGRPAPAAGSGSSSRATPRGSAPRSSSSATSKRRRTPHASARRPDIFRCAAASTATSRSSARTSWYRRFGEMLVDGHARPTVPIYPAISQQLQLAIGSVVSGEKTPDEALDEAWRAVNAEYARQTMTRTSVARRGVDALAVGADRCSRSRFRWRCSGGGRRPTGAACPGCCRRSRSSTIILIYPMLDLLRLSLTDATVAGTPLPLHARELPRAARRRRRSTAWSA